MDNSMAASETNVPAAGVEEWIIPSRIYRTKSQSTAALLRFTLGDDCHVATIMEPGRRASFEFCDKPEQSCEELVKLFYGRDPVPVTDAVRLLICLHKVQQSMNAARRGRSGIWRIESNE